MNKLPIPRSLQIIGMAILVAVLVSMAASALLSLIQFVTNLVFFHRLSLVTANPAENTLGLWVVITPVIGGLIVGMMARYGSESIRGHGIPEAMQQILLHRSRIAPRVAILKPASAAISIGTGGPFGAEGPIIATGGAIGSLVGQYFSMTAIERKILLASGAAAGMTFIFGTPVAAVLLAIELLLFEFRSRSIIPVSLACVSAVALRSLLGLQGPMFTTQEVVSVTWLHLMIFAGMGATIGIISSGITWTVYWVEDQFEKLLLPWMWWPALGGLVVGVIGWLLPATLGVGYGNIEDLVGNKLLWKTAVLLGVGKFLSWVISLGSGTSGGTLAPLLTLGGVLGILFATAVNVLNPAIGLPPSLAALVGMAALFAGASRAMLASMVFAMEVTGQPEAFPALLVACAVSHLISQLVMQNSIMTEKIERRGISIPSDYQADPFQQVRVGSVMMKIFPRIYSHTPIAQLLKRISMHDPNLLNLQAFPVVDTDNTLRGMVSRSDLLQAQENLEATVLSASTTDVVIAYPDEMVHEAIEKMLRYNIGRIPVVERHDHRKLVGLLTRNSILEARRTMSEENGVVESGWSQKRAKSGWI